MLKDSYLNSWHMHLKSILQVRSILKNINNKSPNSQPSARLQLQFTSNTYFCIDQWELLLKQQGHQPSEQNAWLCLLIIVFQCLICKVAGVCHSHNHLQRVWNHALKECGNIARIIQQSPEVTEMELFLKILRLIL